MSEISDRFITRSKDHKKAMGLIDDGRMAVYSIYIQFTNGERRYTTVKFFDPDLRPQNWIYFEGYTKIYSPTTSCVVSIIIDSVEWFTKEECDMIGVKFIPTHSYLG